jgi:hypothetical protein
MVTMKLRDYVVNLFRSLWWSALADGSAAAAEVRLLTHFQKGRLIVNWEFWFGCALHWSD